jgi:diguanylate cyclase (GGDEF)-like protein
MGAPSPTRPTLQERMQRLRTAFLDELPVRLEEVRACRPRLASGEEGALAHLHRILHNLRGTGRSLGFHEVGLAAGACEDLATAGLEGAGTLPPDFDRCLEDLDRLAGIQEAPDGSLPLALPGREQGRNPTGSRLVYLCDDEPLVLEDLALQLGYFGYETGTFADPGLLRLAIHERRPAALVMDVHFPGHRSDGPEALASLWQELGFRVPTLFLSGRVDFDARLRAVQAGAEAYFCKPTRALDLIPVLDALTRQRPPEAYRILIVDDDAQASSYHALILQEAGMLTCELAEPHNVLEVLQDFRPDLILMDVYMPRCSGRDLAMVIRQVPNHFSLPIFYLSSELDKAKQFSAMRVGSEGFITKPVVPEDLVAAVAIGAERFRALQGLMARDGLTGLFNHTTTTQLLERALSVARRQASRLCFAMIDIDRFKLVNDTHGHPVGDQVLLAVAQVLRQRLRDTDIVGRYGGEEFAVVLPGMTLAQGAELLDQLRGDFAQLRFQGLDGAFSSTFSAGLAAFPANQTFEKIRAAADKALYRAKEAGRNQIRCEEVLP